MLVTASLADRPNNYDSPRLLLPHAAGSYAGAVAAPEPECRLTIEQALCCLLMRSQACSLAVIGPALTCGDLATLPCHRQADTDGFGAPRCSSFLSAPDAPIGQIC